MTGRFNLAIVSFLAGCHSRERLRLIDDRSSIAQAHILAWPNKTLGSGVFGMTVLSTKIRRVLWLVSVNLVSCLQFQLMKRKRVWRKLEKTPLGNEVDGLAQASTVT